MSLSSNTQPSWLQWVIRNAQPKQRSGGGPKPQPTRWQKSGPMTREQWVNFYKWVGSNGGLNYQRSVKKPKPISRTFVPGVFFCLESKKLQKLEDEKQLEEKINALSTPRYKRDKYVAPTVKPFPYRPEIRYGKPPKPERGRPWPVPMVPCCFQHEDVQAAFWAKVRFPISKNALRARPTRKIVELAKPRTYPPREHCLIPIDLNNIPRKRKKMTANQWQMHLSRLEYLALPNTRVLADLSCRCGDYKQKDYRSHRTDPVHYNSLRR